MFSQDDHRRVAEAIASAEKATSGEIFCIVVSARQRFPEVALLLAAVAALGLPLVAVLAGWTPSFMAMSGDWTGHEPVAAATDLLLPYALAQLALFTGVALLLLLTPLGHMLTPRRMKQARARRTAIEQFLARGLHTTRARTGVLIFVSLADHLAEIVADEGIYARVEPEVWGDALANMAATLKDGRPADAFVGAVNEVGALLAQHFPAGDTNPNELPDHLVVL